MATVIDTPDLRTRRDFNSRVIALHDALKHMRHGGTASDCRSVLIDLKNLTVSIQTVKRDLWLLHDLGIVALKETEGGTWWYLPRDQSCPLPRSA